MSPELHLCFVLQILHNIITVGWDLDCLDYLDDVSDLYDLSVRRVEMFMSYA